MPTPPGVLFTGGCLLEINDGRNVQAVRILDIAKGKKNR